MDNSDRLNAMARWMWDARSGACPIATCPTNCGRASIAEAYAAQEAYYRLAEPVYGAVGGAKIATTTKVMQRLMGINHPCGGAIFARTIHASPARLATAEFVNLRIESEIALKLGADLPASGAPWTRDNVAPAVAGAMPAFELIEDRHADYAHTEAASLIVENCWNGGVVVGTPKPRPARRWSASPAVSPSAAKPWAKAPPRIPARRWPGSPIISPNVAAISKPAWWSSPAVSSRRCRSRAGSAPCSRSTGSAKLRWMPSERRR